MRLYSGRVRLGGSPLHEVIRENMTAPEVLLLRQLHGGADAVVGLVCTGEKQVDHEQERDRLRREYESFQHEGPSIVDKLFGPAFQPLPLRVAGVPDDAPPEAENAPPVRVPPPSRTKRLPGSGDVQPDPMS